MTWIHYALIAPMLYTVAIFVDKYIVEREIPQVWGLPIYSAITGGVFGTIFWLVNDRNFLPTVNGLMIIFTGMLLLFGAALYFIALTTEASSLIVILVQTQPMMILVLSYFFLNERITAIQMLGFVLILISALALSFSKHEVLFKRLSPGFWLLFGANLLWSISTVLFKAYSSEEVFLTTAAYESWGIALGGALLFVLSNRNREEFLESLKNKKGVRFIFMNESMFVIAKLIGLLAFTLGPASLVSILGSTQVFFALLAGAILGQIAPTIFKENFSKEEVYKKVSWSIVLFTGLYFIQR